MTLPPVSPGPLPVAPYPFDEPLLAEARVAGEPRFAVYRPAAPMVVLGAGSRPEQELDVSACVDAGLPLYRRRGGGCAVVLDPGNVIVSLAYPVAGLGGSRDHFERISAFLIAALEGLGIRGVTMEGASDLAVEDRKIGGACIYRARDLLHYATSLLCDPDLRLMSLLRHPPREPAYRRGRAHLDFVRPLSALPGAWTAGRLAEALVARLDVSRFASGPRSSG